MKDSSVPHTQSCAESCRERTCPHELDPDLMSLVMLFPEVRTKTRKIACAECADHR